MVNCGAEKKHIKLRVFPEQVVPSLWIIQQHHLEPLLSEEITVPMGTIERTLTGDAVDLTAHY